MPRFSYKKICNRKKEKNLDRYHIYLHNKVLNFTNEFLLMVREQLSKIVCLLMFFLETVSDSF